MGKPEMDHFDCCIIGAGVVGLAIARQLAMAGKSTIVLEKAPWYGSEISSRNSEVIHAGIYYPTGSLKATLCVEGKERLYEYCDKNRIPYSRIGKLIVSSSDTQSEQLEQLRQKAASNGVQDLTWVDTPQLRQMEPQVAGRNALLSPSTGIIDSHALMSCLAHDIESCGGILSLKTEFLTATHSGDHFTAAVLSVGENYQFRCTHLINAAGLGAQAVASNIESAIVSDIPSLYFCKGCYFALTGKSPFSRLIYPMPEANTTGLGVHATLDMGGQTKFGPDTEYLEKEDYQVSESRRTDFAAAIRRYFPKLDESRLTPAYAGIRPKIQGPGEPAQDFAIQSYSSGLINLFGIESPGLTAALAIAAYVHKAVVNQ